LIFDILIQQNIKNLSLFQTFGIDTTNINYNCSRLEHLYCEIWKQEGR